MEFINQYHQIAAVFIARVFFPPSPRLKFCSVVERRVLQKTPHARPTSGSQPVAPGDR